MPAALTKALRLCQPGDQACECGAQRALIWPSRLGEAGAWGAGFGALWRPWFPVFSLTLPLLSQQLLPPVLARQAGSCSVGSSRACGAALSCQSEEAEPLSAGTGVGGGAGGTCRPLLPPRENIKSGLDVCALPNVK